MTTSHGVLHFLLHLLFAFFICTLLISTVFFFYGSGYHRYLHSFPTRRSSDLWGEVFPDALQPATDISSELMSHLRYRSEEHTSELPVTWPSRMPSSA